MTAVSHILFVEKWKSLEEEGAENMQKKVGLNDMRVYFDMDGTIAKWRDVPVEETRKPGYYADLEPEVELLDFMRDAMKETELMAALHPGYLKEQQSVIRLSENAIRILRLQAEGMSREDVAKELDMNLDTVKYHIKQIYKKLGVKDKAAAVIQARKRNLI